MLSIGVVLAQTQPVQLDCTIRTNRPSHSRTNLAII
jgi:hypothetical protein